ncbi:MAG: ethylbenzene dehydrogenase-related protein [Phycisphaerales bacterium]
MSSQSSKQDNVASAGAPMPRFVVTGAVLALAAVNMSILGYAISISSPGRVEHASATIELADNAGDPAPLIAGSVPEFATFDDGEYDDEDEDWVFEPIPVVNVFDVPSLADTRPVFLHHCAGCHGIEGRGDGPASGALLPRPRDFFDSEFRYASSGSDRPHVVRDVVRTISRGVPRSAMPGFGGVLTEAQIAGLARYVFDIRERGQDIAPPAEAIGIGVRPPVTPELVARGKELFVSLSCNTCHGDSGRGDGMNADGLVDFLGRPVRPADFTAGIFKTGQTPEDLCRTVLRGVPGTPMIAYESVLAQDNDDEQESVNTMDAWAVVAYIRSFARQPKSSGAASGAVIVAERASDESMLSDPTHPAWLGIEPVSITIKPLQSRPEQTSFIEIRAVRSTGHISMCIDWRDTSLDLSRAEAVYPDAVAVMFGLSEVVPPLLADVELASDGLVDPVNVNSWYWRADRQLAAVTGQRLSRIVLEPDAADNWYLFALGEPIRLPVVTTVEAGELSAEQRTAGYAVVELNARGLGRVDQQPPPGQRTTGAALWSTGSWRVLMSRPLTTEDELDVQFASGGRIPVSFAVWDGAKGDHDEIKLISSWHWLVLGP